MAVLLLTESVVELVGLKMLLTRNLFVSVAVEMSRLRCSGGSWLLSFRFVADISYKLFIFRARSLGAVVHSSR